MRNKQPSAFLITETPSAKAMFIRKDKAIKDALRKIDEEFSGSSKPSDGFFFDNLHMTIILQTVLDNGGTKQAYINVKNHFSLSDTFIKKAKSRHAYKAFKSALDKYNAHPIVPLLNQYKMFNKGYLKCYYNEQVTTGLTRLANNIKIVNELERLQGSNSSLTNQNNVLQLALTKLETSSNLTHKDWFHDIAVPMKNKGMSIKEIAEKTGMKVSTVKQRFRRHKEATL